MAVCDIIAGCRQQLCSRARLARIATFEHRVLALGKIKEDAQSCQRTSDPRYSRVAAYGCMIFYLHP